MGVLQSIKYGFEFCEVFIFKKAQEVLEYKTRQNENFWSFGRHYLHLFLVSQDLVSHFQPVLLCLLLVTY